MKVEITPESYYTLGVHWYPRRFIGEADVNEQNGHWEVEGQGPLQEQRAEWWRRLGYYAFRWLPK